MTFAHENDFFLVKQHHLREKPKDLFVISPKKVTKLTQK